MATTTGAGTRGGVTLKLPQLQNLCKRDPVAYLDDYLAQTRRLESEITLLPQKSTQRVVELIQFCAAVSSSSYKGDESDRIATLLMNLLGKEKADFSVAAALDRDVRKACVSALIIMRNKGTVEPLDLLQLFFNVMVSVAEKGLREMLYRHIVNDIRNLNKKGKREEKVNRSIQTFLHRIVQTSTAANDEAAEIASKRAVNIVCELYRRRIWTDEKAVAIVATAVESPYTSVSNRAMRFFLGMEEQMAADDKARTEDEWQSANTIDYHLHSKKTKTRQRQTIRALKKSKRAQMKKEATNNDGILDIGKDEGVDASKKLFPTIELLRDPQGLAESVFRRLRTSNDKYETKLLRINFITRLTGNHELLILPLYAFLQKYMGGHQRDVTAVLAYTVQACHRYVPPDDIHGILKTIAHNFITDRCSEEQMAVGINAARAICARVPAVLSDEASATSSLDVEAFARDLVSFSKHRDRSVRTAGAAWLNWVRQVYPGLLQGKDRGLDGTALHRAGTKPLRYGEEKAAMGVEGADLLVEYESKQAAAAASKQQYEDPKEEEEEDVSSEEEEEEIEDEEKIKDDEEIEDEEEGEEAPELVRVDDTAPDSVIDLSKMSQAERDKLKQEVSSTRVFSTADFTKMRKLVEREQRAKRDPREAARRKRAVARGQEFEALSDDSAETTDDEQELHIQGAVNPEEIMAAATRKRQSKAEKVEKIMAGRSKFEFKQRDGGSTNVEKNRKKNFLMTKFSREARTKGRGKSGLKRKKKDMKLTGTHESRKRRRKL